MPYGYTAPQIPGMLNQQQAGQSQQRAAQYEMQFLADQINQERQAKAARDKLAQELELGEAEHKHKLEQVRAGDEWRKEGAISTMQAAQERLKQELRMRDLKDERDAIKRESNALQTDMKHADVVRKLRDEIRELAEKRGDISAADQRRITNSHKILDGLADRKKEIEKELVERAKIWSEDLAWIKKKTPSQQDQADDNQRKVETLQAELAELNRDIARVSPQIDTLHRQFGLPTRSDMEPRVQKTMGGKGATTQPSTQPTTQPTSQPATRPTAQPIQPAMSTEEGIAYAKQRKDELIQQGITDLNELKRIIVKELRARGIK